MSGKYPWSVWIAGALLVGGCSGKPVMTPKLQQAQKIYEKRRADAQISEHAPLALLEAGKLYDMSKKARSKAEADHLAYLLTRESEIAAAYAREVVYRKQITALQAAKQKALLDAKESELQRLKQEIESTKARLKEMEELHAKETSRGLVLTLGDVLFASGKATLLPGAERAIDKLVQFLQENPDRKVLIEGHTDNIGSATYNLDLSLRRAEAVKAALVAKGIEAERIMAQGYGERYPVAPNSDAAGRQRNRRVEIVILQEGMEPEDMQRQ